MSAKTITYAQRSARTPTGANGGAPAAGAMSGRDETGS
jgi:hypothetical protein